MDIIKALLSDASERSRTLGRPVVTLSYAQSLDGSLTSEMNKRLVISGPETKRLTHLLRAAHEAILVGIGTLLTDDPKLNARLVGGPHPQVVVLDADLRTPTTAQVLQRTDLKALIVCKNDVLKSKIQALEKAGGRILRVNGDGRGRLDLLEVLHGLQRMGLRSLMVEGGAEVANSFLQARLVDQVVVTVAAMWTGAAHGGEKMLNVDGCFPVVEDPHYDVYGHELVIWGRIGEGRYEEQDAVFHRS
jgi:riboflavin-specific deaminase-like protein